MVYLSRLPLWHAVVSAVLMACTAAVLLLTGCDQSTSTQPLRVGVMAGPEADIMKVAAAAVEKDYGITVKLIEFSDFMSPNLALSDGSIDVNAFQHRPYLDRIVRDRGFKLAAVGNTFIYPIGAYSNTVNDIQALPKGAKIAIPNDPSNGGRALLLLHNSGLITLKQADDLAATPRDILANPNNLQFIELDAAQLPRALADVDLAFINSVYAVPVGLLPTRDALLVEGKDSPYVNVMVARLDNQDDSSVVALVRAYQTPAVVQKAKELFAGGAVPGW